MLQQVLAPEFRFLTFVSIDRVSPQQWLSGMKNDTVNVGRVSPAAQGGFQLVVGIFHETVRWGRLR